MKVFTAAAVLVLFSSGVPASAAQAPNVTVAVLDTGIAEHNKLGWSLDSLGRGSPKLPALAGFDFVSDPWQAADGDGWDADPTDPGDGVRPREVANHCASRASTWHGTNVAGTIRIIAPEAQIVPIRIMGRCGGNTADVAAAVLWAAGLPVPGVPDNPHPADIINLSFSGMSEVCPRALSTAIVQAGEKGSVVVVAAGSRARDTAQETPANCPGVLAVGAVDLQGARAPTSGFGDEVDVSALGGDMSINPKNGIRTTTNLGRYRAGIPGYGYYQSSSAAAARVSATLALLASQVQGSRGESLVMELMNFLDPLAEGDCDQGVGQCGEGIVNLERVQALTTT